MKVAAVTQSISNVFEEHYPYAIFHNDNIKARKRALRQYMREHPLEVEKCRQKLRDNGRTKTPM